MANVDTPYSNGRHRMSLGTRGMLARTCTAESENPLSNIHPKARRR